MANEIWSKGGEATDALVHHFTVGDDLTWDTHLGVYDLTGSIAQAMMLGRVGLITADESAALVGGLRDLHAGWLAGAWRLDTGDEDIHSKVEKLLTERIGEPGKKLHTGRSRNDQVLTDIRLWMLDHLPALALAACDAADALLAQAEAGIAVPFPGYTHQQRGMPSSLGQFYGAHADAMLEGLLLIEAADALADRCPLGSGASYGVGLPLDREYAAKILGFSRPGGIALADGNGRGPVEGAALDAAGFLVGHLSRLSSDLLFFTSGEAGFLTIGGSFTTGSSIMPQKRNLDLFELIRGRAARFNGQRAACHATTVGLISGYGRDLQDTKAMLIDGLRMALGALAVTTRAVPALRPVPERIAMALTSDLYATDEAYRLVRDEGIPFREAYIRVGKHLDQVPVPDHVATLKSRTHRGSTGNLGLDELREKSQHARAAWLARRRRRHEAWAGLLSRPIGG